MPAKTNIGLFIIIAILAVSAVNAQVQSADTIFVKWEKITTRLSVARSLAVTPFSALYIVEEGKNRLLSLNFEGKRNDSLGTLGFGEYQFDNPQDVDATNGLKIYVSDYNNRRIQIYDRRFQYLTTIMPRGNQNFYNYYRPTQLAVNSMLELFFYDEANRTIIKHNFQGELDFTYSARTEQIGLPPVDMETLDNQLLVADSQQGVIHLLAEGGQYLKFWGDLGDLRALAVGERRIWALSSHLLRSYNRRGIDELNYTLGPVTNPVDIAVSDKYLFLITSNTLWRGLKPAR